MSQLWRVLAIGFLLTTAISNQHAAHASEAIIIGGGSHVHDSQTRFEESVLWVGSVLSEQGVTFTTHFNDGKDERLDTYYNVNDPTAIRPLARIFNDSDIQTRSFRNHSLSDVTSSTRIEELEAAIHSQLADNIDEELLLVHSGLGGYSGSSEHNVSMNLWDNSTLSAFQLHQWLMQHERPVRFVMAHSNSGGFHRIAYRDSAKGIELNDTTHCGFTSNSAYGEDEIAIANPDTRDYRDYLSYFFSALSGYEYDGEIISRLSDLDEDGQTSLREAHLFTLEEAMSIDLPLSTSEDYLLRWQPWYLRWQPAPKQLPNNEYTRIFRDVANRLKIPLGSYVAKEIRNRLTLVETQLQAIEQRRFQENSEIVQLQGTIRAALVSQWPILAAPYSQGFETLIRSNQIPLVESYIEQFQPQYTDLLALQEQSQISELEHLGKHREKAQFYKLLRLRHLALVKQQLYQHGTQQHIAGYRSLLKCEESPLTPSSFTTLLTEEASQ